MEQIAFTRKLLSALGFDLKSALLGPEGWASATGLIVFGALGYFAPETLITNNPLLLSLLGLTALLILSYLTALVYPLRQTHNEKLNLTLGGLWLTREAKNALNSCGNLEDVLIAEDRIAGRVWGAASRGSARALSAIALAAFAFSTMRIVSTAVITRPSSTLRHAIATWIPKAEKARENQLVVHGVALPTDVKNARSAFELAWNSASLRDKQSQDQERAYDALKYVVRIYRVEESSGPDMAVALRWADETVNYFEQCGNKKLLIESLFEKAAVYIDLSQINHTDPDRFARVSDDGDRVMGRVNSLAADSQKAEALRMWSRFYYNLARPKTGVLSEPWDVSYMSLAYERARDAYLADPKQLKNCVQMARSAVKLAEISPRDRDETWTRQLRSILSTYRAIWLEHDAILKKPVDRVPALENQAVLTGDVALREWAELRMAPETPERRRRINRLIDELETYALRPQREVMALVKLTEWEKPFAFDLPYELAKIHVARYLLLIAARNPGAQSEFEELTRVLQRANNAANGSQRRSMLRDLRSHYGFTGIDERRRRHLIALVRDL